MLYTRKTGNCTAERHYGGITVYAESVSELEGAISSVEGRIVGALKESLLINGRGLRSVGGQNIEAEYPERIASGVIGYLIGRGEILGIQCLGSGGGEYRSYFLATNRSQVEQALCVAFDALRRTKPMKIKEIEAIVFGPRSQGTWMQAATIANSLAWIGLANHLGRFEVGLSEGAIDAADNVQQFKFNIYGGILAIDRPAWS
jgi:hypothetical protein